MAECGDEQGVKFFCCGGEGCNVISDYFSALPRFFKATICCFKDTTIGNCLTCSGNVVADLKAVVMVQMWLAIAQVILVAALIGSIVAASKVTETAEDKPDATAAFIALVPTLIFTSIIICFVYSLNYYGVIERKGLCCCIPCCWCMEGSLVMYLMGGLSVLGGIGNLAKAFMTETDGNQTVKAILFLSALPVTLFQLYGGVLMIKIGGLSEDERDKELVGSDEEAPNSDEEYYN